MHTGLWWGNTRGRDHLEDVDVDVRIILKCIFKKKGVDWVDLAQDRDRWLAVLSTVTNLRLS